MDSSSTPFPAAPVLLVDDSEDDTELFLLGLEQLALPNPIHVCRDGVDALDYLLRQGAHAGRCGPQPLLVLSDIKMPGMDGIELLRRIRADERLRMLPVVMMTSSNQQQDVGRAYALQANGFVTKPVEFNQLVLFAQAIVQYWVRLNHLPSALLSGRR